MTRAATFARHLAAVSVLPPPSLPADDVLALMRRYLEAGDRADARLALGVHDDHELDRLESDEIALRHAVSAALAGHGIDMGRL